MKRGAGGAVGTSGIALGSLIGAGALALVAAYQLRILSRLPDLPGDAFDSERIVSSPEARIIGVPDGLLGVGSYAATFALAKVVERHPASRLLRESLALKVRADAVAGVLKALQQWPKYKAVCSWCLVATAAAIGNLVLLHYAE